MSKKMKSLLLVLPVVVLVVVLLLSAVSAAAPLSKGVSHLLYQTPSGTIYNVIYHVYKPAEALYHSPSWVLTHSVYPQCGPLKNLCLPQ